MAFVYALKDVKLGKFYPPTIYQSDEDAKRSISDLLKYAPESMLSRHPEDFQLYCIGIYDDSAGVLLNLRDEQGMSVPQNYVFTCNDLCKADLKVVK